MQFDGVNDFVTFGGTGLGVSTFTIETWFRRSGAGVGTSTGTGGIASAVPLLTKGRAEGETPANVNMDYFLGIDASTGVLVTDFEDFERRRQSPAVWVSTVITQKHLASCGRHVAAPEDADSLYLDGALEGTMCRPVPTPRRRPVSSTPRWAPP